MSDDPNIALLPADDELLRRAMVRLGHGSLGFTGEVLWVAVKEIFGMGSGYSMALCRRFGLDPHATIPKRRRRRE